MFHYTSLSGLLGIAQSKNLWASEIRYLNDTDEIKILSKHIAAEVLHRKETGAPQVLLLEQFLDWLQRRVSDGPMVFVGSFTEKGNLLSQWRGYCSYGMGVSIGFEPSLLTDAANDASFAVGRCIYKADDHKLLAGQVVESILKLSETHVSPENSIEHQSHYSLFSVIESDLLKLSALIKSSSFAEECEWRLISPVFSNYVEAPIRYRPGSSALVPYLELPLPVSSNGAIAIRQTVVGPTSTPGLSIRSVSRFLSKQGVSPNCVFNSSSSYREL